eukprot:CAMPEP_0173329036 /NCGR_PEP_ID=MMETSP1144-20121109/2495_1 /TAXON_ID=483371 /ORGANISM="non described non described, Strain CCMP2298" /LENGTH=147 /DNA_ID=CAMNT_0014273607 /DNA_START=55 /DNA_END=494 /DNA_ORIENTATION=+
MSTQPLKEDADRWSLASDAKLLEYLKEFSMSITTRTKACADSVDELAFSVAESEVELRNTFNDFLMLGNTQFVENRVYDDDEDEEPPTPLEPSFSDDLAENLREAFTLGQAAMSLFFLDDSPDKFEDIYNIRPLPYIIGTKSYVDSA